MPSLTFQAGRHAVVDARPGHYLCFPDVVATPQGRLVCVYRQADRHVATRAALLVSTSDDLGGAWSGPRLLRAGQGHCPRITRLEDGRLLVIDDTSASQYWSLDEGHSFARQPCAGPPLSIPDRVLALRPDLWLTTCHVHRGESPLSKIRQAPAEQTVYVSSDEGALWRMRSVLANDRSLVLCEASMTRLPDGRLLAVLRENSHVYEPMYLCLSEDEGVTWSLPRPTPLLGHRPTLGLAPSGRLLVTYRAVGPDGGTAAWTGTLDELDQDFAVHGLHPDPENPRLTPEGLLIENAPGREACVRYALRPMTDPERARATLTAEVLVAEAQGKACALHFGGWWRLAPGAVLPPDDAPAIPCDARTTVRLELRYEPGRVEAVVNGVACGTYPADARAADTRAILAGNASVREDNGGRHLWKALSLSIDEPRFERAYRWSWTPTRGHPDAWVDARVLELANDRLANPGDYGYSGWTVLPDGRYYCVFHHGGGDEPGYQPGRSSRVRGVWFEDSDFTTPNS
ncbi:hypothetical protein NNJEOMEG_02870 [Fundidesulfovibrio magnetotacticus]|uniref:Sialidase domain-containing protein n=1 Tax=Fundidesulfovibrio magnetotacticus TaxID=2730080 RepID=A0A6V8LRA5_9BACT|nr:sialidase family protein [Fundidesulfovibrio magnetotacticus]GFK95022.1 hypothetical protein NNJEOMEG_02870 [Fundidesulfovibrio magnetotacticus]